MLHLALISNRFKKAVEFLSRQKLRQPALAFRFLQLEFLAGLLANVGELVVTQPFLASEVDELGDDFRFRLLV